MTTYQTIKEKIVGLPNNTGKEFEALCLEVFEFQYHQNSIYKQYVEGLGIQPNTVDCIEKIPFLPISFYKKHQVLCKNLKPTHIFESSGTTGNNTSRNYLCDPAFYHTLSQKTFELFYGELSQYHILALLPSYLERGNSSLAFMVDHFIKESQSASGFFLNEFEKIKALCSSIEEPIILWGVTFALLDLVEQLPFPLTNGLIMETGGMKGRRKEMIREEIHSNLCTGFQVPLIHSEYGMTELISQSYSTGNGIFNSPPWMKIIIREANDPLTIITTPNKAGGINVIDLGNIDTCCFIETKDLGKVTKEGFYILGRFDNSDIRGCNLMIS